MVDKDKLQTEREKITIIDKIEPQYMNLKPNGEVEMVYKILESHEETIIKKSKCANCGNIFNGSGLLCSEKCEKEYEEYVFGDN